MIYVPKPRDKVPRAFLAAAREELKKVAPLFRLGQGRKPGIKFTAYRNKELVRVLEDLFYRKCAYCEANYAITGYLEVEHCRPKSLYPWLAADWSNLLPSCKRCNNGKLSKFPLVDPRKEAREKGQEKREMPLLLNPSDPAKARRPEKHLTFDVNDGAIRPVVNRGRPSPIGTTSIEVFRLARTELSQLRKAWRIRAENQVAFCKLARRTGNAAEREIAYQSLKDIVEPSQPFRALTLQVLHANGVKRAQ